MYRFLILWVVPVLLLCGVRSASAAEDSEHTVSDELSDEAQAISYFNTAKDYFDKGNFDTAAVFFRKAYGVKPAWRLLYNIGQTEAAAKNHGRAYEAFELYLVEGGDDLSLSRQREVREELERLRPMVGTVEIFAPKGASVFVDDEMRGTIPDASLLKISAGRLHKIRIEQDGKVLLSASLKLSGDQRKQLRVETAAAKTAASTDGGKQLEPAVNNDSNAAKFTTAENGGRGNTKLESSKWIRAGWTTMGIGLGVLVGGAITGSAALSINSDLKDSCSAEMECLPAEHKRIDRMEALGTTSTLLLSVGGATVITGAVLLLVGKKNRERLVSQAQQRRWRVSPAASHQSGMLLLTGRF